MQVSLHIQAYKITAREESEKQVSCFLHTLGDLSGKAVDVSMLLIAKTVKDI